MRDPESAYLGQISELEDRLEVAKLESAKHLTMWESAMNENRRLRSLIGKAWFVLEGSVANPDQPEADLAKRLFYIHEIFDVAHGVQL